MNVYETESVFAGVAGTTEKTFRKYSGEVIRGLEKLDVVWWNTLTLFLVMVYWFNVIPTNRSTVSFHATCVRDR